MVATEGRNVKPPPDPEPPITEIYCSTCGCPRKPYLHPCPECFDWQFSVIPNVLYLHGWLKRRVVSEKE